MKSQQPGLENASTEILDPPDTISMATQLQQFLFKSMRKNALRMYQKLISIVKQ